MDLGLIVVVSILLPLVAASPFGPLQIVFGVPAALFFPGYALSTALFPRRTDIEAVFRVALSFGFSLALLPMLGLFLNATPWGIRPTPMLIGIAVMNCGLALFAYTRTKGFEPQERFGFVPMRPFVGLARGGGRGVPWAWGAVIVLGFVLVGGSVALRIASPPQTETFTEFYVLGAAGRTGDYVTRFPRGEPVELQIGLANHEAEPQEYAVMASVDGRQHGSVGPVALAAGERWEGEIEVTLDEPAGSYRLQLQLFLASGGDPYRELHLFVRVP
ncbi:MAG: DUF1616 domain-containing protein [Chloroflexi bacterium]|nr:DUF1616 domain-containing protein [Chloroflexota bacterium]